ncbi:MAG: 2-amino-4-hydroxy-6-hydroxymethyldihydropteridine diphosphokinase [Bacteroidales bacterium]|nr:2-amino-4-hydroxy-6-hydroxymethyldihydropteridine diphosphokinase [Bacteroidales bacterium]
MQLNTVFILLGTNLGNREANLRDAITKITELCIHKPIKSSVYETLPIGFDSDLKFLNQVISIVTSLDPFELLEKLLEIELLLGRERQGKGYSSRTIDLDIVYFNSDIIQSETLTVPHPRLHLRRFTMVPMVEIAPDFIHPVLGLSQTRILSQLEDKNEVRNYDITDHPKD